MPRFIDLTASKTYASKANAIKAVEKKFGDRDDMKHLRYFIYTDDNGRFFPIFLGEAAIQAMVHFHFSVAF